MADKNEECPEVKVDFDPETDLDLYPQGECGRFYGYDAVVFYPHNGKAITIPVGESSGPPSAGPTWNWQTE